VFFVYRAPLNGVNSPHKLLIEDRTTLSTFTGIDLIVLPAFTVQAALIQELIILQKGHAVDFSVFAGVGKEHEGIYFVRC
jgi:hypothetical protein